MLGIRRLAFKDIEEKASRIQKIADSQRKEFEIKELASLITRTFSYGLNALEVSLCFGGNETAKLFLSSENFHKNFRPTDQLNPLFFYLSDDRVEEIDDEVFELLLTNENLTEYKDGFNIINYLILAQDKLSNSNLVKVLKKLKTLEEQGNFDVYRSFLNNYVFFLFETYGSLDYNLKKIDLRHPTPESIKLHKSNLEKLKILNQYFPLGENCVNFGRRNEMLFFILNNKIQDAIDIILESDGKIDFYYPDQSKTIFQTLVANKDPVNFIKFLKNIYESTEMSVDEKSKVMFHNFQDRTNSAVFLMLMSTEHQKLKDDIILEASKENPGFQSFFQRIFINKISFFKNILTRLSRQEAVRGADLRSDYVDIETENRKAVKEKDPKFLKIFNSYSQELKKLLGLDDSEDLFVVATKKKNDYVSLKFNDKITNTGNGKILRDVFFGHFRELKHKLFLAQSCFFVNLSFNKKVDGALVEKAFEDIKIKLQDKLFLQQQSQQESVKIEALLGELKDLNTSIASNQDAISKLERLKTIFEQKGKDVTKQTTEIATKTEEIVKINLKRSNVIKELNKFGYEDYLRTAGSKTEKKDDKDLLSTSLPTRKTKDDFASAFASHVVDSKDVVDSKFQRAQGFREKYEYPDQTPEIEDLKLPNSEELLSGFLSLRNPRTSYKEILTGDVDVFSREDYAVAKERFNPKNFKQFTRGCLLVLKNNDYDFSYLNSQMQDAEFQEKFEDFCKEKSRKSNYSNKLKFLFHQKFATLKEKICDGKRKPQEVADMLYIFLSHCHQNSRESLLTLYEKPTIREGIGHASGADNNTLKKSIFALDKFLEISETDTNGDKAFEFLRTIQEYIINPTTKAHGEDMQHVISREEITIDNSEYFTRLIEDFAKQQKYDDFYDLAKNKTKEFCQRYANILVELYDKGLEEGNLKIINDEFNQQIELLRKLSQESEALDSDKFFKILNDNPDLRNLIYEVSEIFEDLDLPDSSGIESQLTKLQKITEIFGQQDFTGSLSSKELEGYEAILSREPLLSVGSLRRKNIEIYENAEANFVKKSQVKERLNSLKI